MKPYAFYRLPYKEKYTSITSEQDAEVINSYKEIGEKAGFIISPFSPSTKCPVLLIHPDNICENFIPTDDGVQGQKTDKERSTCEEDDHEWEKDCSETVTESYRRSFTAFHAHVADHTFRKLVLSRTKEMALSCEDDAKDLFLRTCKTFPRLMVMLFHTQQSGTWLIASPEILIERTEDSCHTVALAGTMPYKEGYAEWSSKNKEEQHIVEEYISQTLAPFAKNVIKDGPVTMRAGNLAHLRTDFRFQGKDLGALVSSLHPTPAVCGLPKREAMDFILTTEPHDREYYSGFAGPLNILGNTHLFVSLRCCKILGKTIRLYAGGGIMPDSICESEWLETEQKMKTISCIATKKT